MRRQSGGYRRGGTRITDGHTLTCRAVAKGSLNGHRTLVVAAIGLCAALWSYACGDGATEPPPPAPDPPRPATVAVGPATVQFTAVGATAQLTVEVRDQNGNAMAGATVTWASSAAAVATASAGGVVTAVANGTATITATAGSAAGSAMVTLAQEVSAVAVTPAADTVVAGDTLRLAAEAADANGHPVVGTEFDWLGSSSSASAWPNVPQAASRRTFSCRHPTTAGRGRRFRGRVAS